jgi:hypothetical protein
MHPRLAAGLLATIVLGIPACGSDSNDENQSVITAAQATVVGQTIGSQMGNIPTSFTAADIQGGVFGAPRLGTHAGERSWRSSGPCPAIDDPTDADDDGVPDDAILTFLVADCTTIGLERSGTIHIVDPSTTTLGYNATITDFTLLFATSGNPDSVLLVLDGTHNVTATTSVATLSENLVTTVSALNNGQSFNGSTTSVWQAVFTAASGQTIDMGLPLPDGSFNFSGTFDYDVNEDHFVLDVTTMVPLVYDASCFFLGIPFTAGKIKAHPQGAAAKVFLTATFTACGELPTVQLFE